MSISISDLIIAAHATDDTRDATIIMLVTEHSLSINAATKAYAAVAKAEGWTTALVSHKDAVLAMLAEQFPESQWDVRAVKDVIVDIVAEYGVAESTARDYCKAHSKSMGVDHPVADPRTAMFTWLVENAATATKDEFKAFAGKDGLGRSDSNVNEYWKGLELHRAILAAS